MKSIGGLIKFTFKVLDPNIQSIYYKRIVDGKRVKVYGNWVGKDPSNLCYCYLNFQSNADAEFFLQELDEFLKSGDHELAKALSVFKGDWWSAIKE